MKKTTKSELYVVDVLPLVRGFREPSISYFSSQPFFSGDFIKIPFRSKERRGVVLSSTPASRNKAQIKNAGFSLRKIKKQDGQSIFNPAFFGVVDEVAELYATSPGEVLTALVPASIINTDKIPSISHGKESERDPSTPYAFDGPYLQRISAYVSEIKKTLANEESVIILAPTVEDAQKLTHNFRSHLDESVYELSSRLTGKKQLEVWDKLVSSDEPVVVVLTSGFLSLPLARVGLCILEKSGSGSYYGLKKPYLDARVVFEKKAAAMGARLIFGDVLTPLAYSDKIGEAKIRSLWNELGVEVVNMVESKDDTKVSVKKKEFKLLSDELLDVTKKTISEGGRVFWFVSRRGLFPSTVCRDCGNEYSCAECDSSLVLHKKTVKGKEVRAFLCHRCGNKETATALCRNCNSWRLEPLGIGIDRVVEEAQKYTEAPFVVSSDATPTKTSIKRTVKNFFTSEDGSLLIGTDLVLPFLEEEQVDVAGIISMDSRLAIPSYAAEESALRTLLTVSSLARNYQIVQTRRSDHRVFVHRSGIDLSAFREEEAKMRKVFSYPPFGTLVEISLRGSKAKSSEVREKITSQIGTVLEERETIHTPPLRGTKKRGVYKAAILLKLSRNLKEAKLLREFLQSLPPSVEVRVDPQNLW